MAETKSLAKKLAHVMTQVKYIEKRGYNKAQNYKYATEADVNDKVREVLAEKNILMLPSMKSHSVREVATKSGGTQFIVCVDMEFRFIDGETGEEFTINMSGEGQDVGDKAIYKAISGAQKYALMKVFMIPTGDDPEDDSGERSSSNDNYTPQHSQPQQTQQRPQSNGDMASDRQLGFLEKKAKAKGLQGSAFTNWVNKEVGHSPEQLTKSEASKLIDALDSVQQGA